MKPLLDPTSAGKLLDDVIYERLCSLVDVQMFDMFRRELERELLECGVVDSEAHRIAHAMYEKAMLRLADRPFGAIGAPGVAVPEPCNLCAAFGDLDDDDLNGHA